MSYGQFKIYQLISTANSAKFYSNRLDWQHRLAGRSWTAPRIFFALLYFYFYLMSTDAASRNRQLIASDPLDFLIFLRHCGFKWNSKSVQFGLSVLNNSAWNLIKKPIRK